jgi:PAS domain S-box-containing protein
MSAVAVWQRRDTPGATAATFLLLGLSLWSFANVAELIAIPFSLKVFWANIQYFSISSGAVLLLITALKYSSGGSRPTRKSLYLLFIIPIITIVLVWTNDWHGLMRSSTWLDTNGSTPVIGKVYGPWFWLLYIYNYALLLLGAISIARIIYTSPLLYKAQAVTMLIGVFCPWIGNILYIVLPRTIMRYDVTPLTFTCSGVAAVLALYRFGLFDIAPAAREAVVESMNDGLLVIDLQNRIVDINPAFRAILALGDREVIGLPVADYFPACPDLIEKSLNRETIRELIVAGVTEEKRHFAFHVDSLSIEDKRRVGYVITMHDVTTHRREEDERDCLIRDLQKALAEVKTLRGMLPICACCKKIRDDEGYWTGLEQYLAEHSELQFTHGICPECERKLYPIPVA